jgi:hypothetical protein
VVADRVHEYDGEPVKRILILLLALLGFSCGDQTHDFGPISSQGGAATTSFNGIIDPTSPAGWLGTNGMVACPSSCSNALADQNTAAFQSTVNYAAAHNKAVYVPPGRYPMRLTSGQPYAVDLNGDNNLTIIAYNAIFMLQGDQASSPGSILWIRNASNVHIEGAQFSLRDATNAATTTNEVKIGDGGATTSNWIELVDTWFLEGNVGDCVLMDGGNAATVTRVTISRASRFETCAQSAIHIKPGIQELTISHNWFKNQTGRDIWIESPSDGVVGRTMILNNGFERSPSATTITSVELAGFGGTNDADVITFKYNKIIGGVLVGSNLSRARITSNPEISYNRAGGAGAVIDLSGRLSDVWVDHNYLKRGGSATNGPVVNIAGAGGNSPNGVWLVNNRIRQYAGNGDGIQLTGSVRTHVVGNYVSYHASTADSGSTGFSAISCAGDSTAACSGFISMNDLRRDDQDIRASLNLATKTINDNTVIEATFPGTYGNNITIAFVGDSGSNAGSRVEVGQAITIHYKPAGSKVSDVETLINASSQIRVKTAGTAATVLQVGDAFSATNLAGAAQAGRMLAGVKLLKGGSSTVGGFSIRDNKIDGAAAAYRSDADGSSQWPEGFPVISGNIKLNCAAEFAGGITTWVPESTATAETITSGAADVTKSMTFISTTGTVAYSQPDGISDGWIHCYKIKAAVSSPSGTMTPAHLFDGTTHTITWTTAGGAFCLSWDKTAATNRVVSSTGVTVN